MLFVLDASVFFFSLILCISKPKCICFPIHACPSVSFIGDVFIVFATYLSCVDWECYFYLYTFSLILLSNVTFSISQLPCFSLCLVVLHSYFYVYHWGIYYFALCFFHYFFFQYFSEICDFFMLFALISFTYLSLFL